MITIFIPTPLRRFAAEQSRVNLQATTVSDAVKSLTFIHPSLKPYLYDESEAIRKHVRIYLGDEDVRDKEGLLTILKEGDELSIIPAIAGGCNLSPAFSQKCRGEKLYTISMGPEGDELSIIPAIAGGIGIPGFSQKHRGEELPAITMGQNHGDDKWPAISKRQK